MAEARHSSKVATEVDYRLQESPVVLFSLVGAMVLMALFFIIRPLVDVMDPAGLHPPVAAFDLAVESGVLVGGSRNLRVYEGQRVQLRIVSDRSDELHVHGYDIGLELMAREPTVLEFVAVHSGRFEIESHEDHRLLAVLEVRPR